MVRFLCLFMALSVDTFLASLSYGVEKIRMSKYIYVLISGICSGFLLLSLFLGEVIKSFLREDIVSNISFSILLLLGTWKLIESILKHQKTRRKKRQVEAHSPHFKKVINMRSDYLSADQDQSKDISVAESILLAIALSMDSFIAGITCIQISIHPILIFLLCSILNLLILEGGYLIGKKISKRVDIDLSWFAALLFFVLAFLKR